jgi:hypothetical protein
MEENVIKDRVKRQMPSDRAAYYIEISRQLSLVGANTSLELEKILKDIHKAISFVNDECHYYMFLGKVFRTALDLTSAIFCYRYALKLEPSNLTAMKFLNDLLITKGKI